MTDRIHKLAPIPSKPKGVITPSLPVLSYLCERARPDEVEQYRELTFGEYDPEAAAVAFWRAGKWALAVADSRGVPAAAGGFEEVQPGVWQSWMVGTPEGWARCWVDIHRATRFLIERLVDSGLAHRLQTTALAKRSEACQWYERLGLTLEGTMRGYSASGLDVVMYGRPIARAETEVL